MRQDLDEWVPRVGDAVEALVDDQWLSARVILVPNAHEVALSLFEGGSAIVLRHLCRPVASDCF